MSSVFLADIDDYLSPSNACVNPLFTNTSSSTSSNHTSTKTDLPQEANAAEEEGVIKTVSRRRRTIKRPLLSSPLVGNQPAPRSSNQDEQQESRTTTTTTSKKNNSKVIAEIADCLACSGCITTAETVLLQEHSTDKFRIAQQDHSQQTIVVTLSIASAAELLRLLLVPSSSSTNSPLSVVQESDLTILNRKLASLLCQQLGVSAVVDGALALEWSLQQSAKEFCERFQQKQQLQQSHSQSQSPIISSSCPATVCLVEKTHHSVVPNLSTVKSPMAASGTYLSNNDDDDSSSSSSDRNNQLFHVGIMPCHDKKLEATRADIASNVHLVLTTMECWKLLLESVSDASLSTGDDAIPEEKLRALFHTVEPAIVDFVPTTVQFQTREQNIVPHSWITSSSPSHGNTSTSSPAPSRLTYTSGGYAEYIFRYASYHLFGASLNHVEWKSVPSSAMANGPSNGSSTRAPSARVASARRDILVATLYRHEYRTIESNENGMNHDDVATNTAPRTIIEYSSHDQPSMSQSSNASTTPVLRFAMAHGLQVMQRAMQNESFDYVEAMACPSGCLNGGGQILLRSREAPSETRQRVVSASQQLRLNDNIYHPETTTIMEDDGSTLRKPQQMDLLQTRFRAVQPLQLQSGATKGMAVKDIQW